LACARRMADGASARLQTAIEGLLLVLVCLTICILEHP